MDTMHSIWAGLIEPSEPEGSTRLQAAFEELASQSAFEDVCWQPSAMSDFGDVHCLARAGCDALGIARTPRFFVHTDVLYPRADLVGPGTGLEEAGGRTVLAAIPVQLRVTPWLKMHGSLIDGGGDAPFDSQWKPTGQGVLLKLSEPAHPLVIPRRMLPRPRDIANERYRPDHLDHRGGEETWVLQIGMSNWQFIMLALAARLRTRTIYRSNEGLSFGGCNVSINGAAKWFRTMGCENLIDMAPPGRGHLDEHADRIGEAFLRSPLPYWLSRGGCPYGVNPDRDNTIGPLREFFCDNASLDRRFNAARDPRVLRLNPLSANDARDFNWTAALERYFEVGELPQPGIR